MKKNMTMALINMDICTVELFKEMKELKEIIDRFGEDVSELQNMIIVSEEEIPKVIDTKKISIIAYHDEITNKFYDELSFEEYQEIKEKSIEKKQEMLNKIAIEVYNIQSILSCGGWCFEVEEYLLDNGYDKSIFNRFGNIEVNYIKNDIHIEIINDLEVVFYNGFMRLVTIEKKRNIVLVKY